MKTRHFLTAAMTAGALTMISCTQTQQKYGLGGAAAGAAAGALFGGDGSDIAKGAAVGGALGAGYGAYNERQQGNASSGGLFGNPAPQPAPTPAPAPPANEEEYLKAWGTDTPGIVVSPYKPYNKVDVSEFQPGQLARDPKTGKVFIVPN